MPNFVVSEIGSHSHIHCLIAAVKIISINPENSVTAVVKPSDRKNISELDRIQNVSIIVLESIEDLQPVYSKLNENSISSWIFTTLEPTSYYNIKIINSLRRLKISGKIFLGVHNVDVWLNLDRLKLWNDITSPEHSLILRWYKIKIQIFRRFSRLFKNLVKRTNGGFILVSKNTENEFKRLAPNLRTIVIPSDIYDDEYCHSLMVQPLKEKLRIVIPGYISNIRRDYLGFLKAIKYHLPSNYINALTIELLGSTHRGMMDGEMIIEEANNLINEGYDIIIHNKGFIPTIDFDMALAQADIVAAIINLNQDGTQKYGKTKESGTIYTMIKMAKPGLVPADYPVPPEIEDSILRYNSWEDFIRLLVDLINENEQLKKLSNCALINSRKFSRINLWKSISFQIN